MIGLQEEERLSESNNLKKRMNGAKLEHLRAALNKQAIKSPGSPGSPCSMSITKKMTTWSTKRKKKDVSTIQSTTWQFKQPHISSTKTHRIFFRGGQEAVVSATVARKHDQTHHTAESQSQLQGGEHHVARPAHSEVTRQLQEKVCNQLIPFTGKKEKKKD